MSKRRKKIELVNFGDETTVAQAEKQSENVEDMINEGLRGLVENRNGRELIWWMLSSAGIYQTSFTGNSTTFFNEGRRAIGLELLDRLISTRPSAYAQMIEEHNTDG
tara:strand:+ start:582 stop:902 length:321 start_codon:yes stop_codon:yes gene_type:complete